MSKVIDRLKADKDRLIPDFKKIISRVDKKGIVFLIFPLIIISIYLLPTDLQYQLRLHVKNPEIYQFITSGFVHGTFEHMQNNLLLYFLFIVPQILFISGKKKIQQNYFKLCSFLIISSIIVSSIIVALTYPTYVSRIQTTLGFSGALATLLGSIPIVWISYLESKKTKILDQNMLTLFMLFIPLMFCLIYYPLHQEILMTLVMGGLFSYYVFVNYKKIKIIGHILKEEAKKNIVQYELLILSPLVFILAPFMLFPTDLIQQGALVDFAVHYIGFVYGLIATYYVRGKIFKI